MKDTKYIIIDASLYDYTYIEQKLTRMAAQGWHLEHAGSLLWKFRYGEPKAVRYAVTYAPTASVYNSQPTEAEEDLADLCAQAGWVRVTNQAQRIIYRNDDPTATPLETDEGERLKNIRKTMRKHFFPIEALMILVFLMQFYTQWRSVNLSPARSFSSYMMITTLAMSLIVSLTHAIMALDGALWLRRARIVVDGGGNIPENQFYRIFRWFIWGFLIAYLLCLLWTVSLGFLVMVLIICAAALLVTLGGLNLCKKLNAPRWVNLVVPTGLSVLLMFMLIPTLAVSMDRSGNVMPPAETLPVTMTQLTGETGTERLVLEESESFLCSHGRYWDTAENDVRLAYTIVDVKCPLLYDTLLNEQEKVFLMGAGHITDPDVAAYAALFETEYIRHARNASGDRWLLCWDSRIVNLRATWDLTQEQLQILKDLLKP